MLQEISYLPIFHIKLKSCFVRILSFINIFYYTYIVNNMYCVENTEYVYKYIYYVIDIVKQVMSRVKSIK